MSDTSDAPAPAGPLDPSTTTRRVVFVAGSGRSGTSTLSGILRELSLHVPQPEVVANQTNPKGFGEPRWVVDLHKRLLRRGMVHASDARPKAWEDTARIGSQESVRAQVFDWLDQQLGEADELVIKDPRLAWFLGLWRVAATRCGAQPCFATMLRPPTEVVGSKVKYYGSRRGEISGMAAWVNLMLHTEQATRGSARVFIRYHDLLDDWTTSVFRAGKVLDLHGVQTADAAQIEKVNGFIDPSLRRVQTTWDDFSGPDALRTLAADTWEQLNRLADPDGDTPEVHAALDALRQRYYDFYEAAEAVAQSSVVVAAREARRASRRAKETAPPAVTQKVPNGWRTHLPPRLSRQARRVVNAVQRARP